MKRQSAKSKAKAARVGHRRAAQKLGERERRQKRQLEPHLRPNIPIDGRKLVVAPKTMKLTRAETKRTLVFVRRFTRIVIEDRSAAVLNLTLLEEISSAAATILAAEIAKCLEVAPNSLTGVPPKSLAAARMLDLYGVTTALGMPSPPNSRGRAILRLRNGYADEIRRTEFIERFLAPLFPTESPLKGRIKGAVTEALLNIVDHAYPSDWNAPRGVRAGRWWISGLRVEDEKRLYICVYDQGVGLPFTLPRSKSDAIRHAVASLTGENAGHRMIRTAVHTSLTQTGLQGRGRGLREMAKLIDRAGDGALWITSADGTYLYGKGTFAQDLGWTNSVALGGSLIMWTLRITDAATSSGENTIGE